MEDFLGAFFFVLLLLKIRDAP